MGRRGEALAEAYLHQHGYEVLERNYRCPAGEIDLVARQGEGLVFVEVKTRRSRRFGLPEEALTPRKRAHLLAAAQTYLQQQDLSAAAWRVDVIAIELSPAGEPRLRHIQNAVISQ